MRAIGIEFAASDMNYVVLDCSGDGTFLVVTANRLSLADTRSPDDLRVFQQAVKTLLSDLNPNRVAIKAKPERGGMAAGAAALKMEALVLASVPCDVRFISGARINKCMDPTHAIKAYHLPAYKAATCACDDE